MLHDVLLIEQLLSVMREISAELFMFQQDSAPAYRACETMMLTMIMVVVVVGVVMTVVAKRHTGS